MIGNIFYKAHKLVALRREEYFSPALSIKNKTILYISPVMSYRQVSAMIPIKQIPVSLNHDIFTFQEYSDSVTFE